MNEDADKNLNDYDENINDSTIEDTYEPLMIDEEFESSYEDFMIESALEDSYELAMIEASIENAYEDAMIEASIESAYEDDMIDNMHSYISTKDATENVHFLFDKDLNYKTVNVLDIKHEDNIKFRISKIYEKSSNTGKTAYFSYMVSDIMRGVNKIEIDGVICSGSSTEYWVSWKYNDGKKIEVSKYFKDDEDLSSALYFPLNYNYAEILQLNKYNPNNFHFKKLDFLRNNNTTSCGDKFSICKIASTNNSYQKFYINDFAVNIITLMKNISKYSSINEYIVVEFLKMANHHISKIKNDLNSNEYTTQSISNIVSYTKSIIDNRLKYIKSEIKQNLNSELSILMSEFDEYVKTQALH